jgi:hypothetical protein
VVPRRAELAIIVAIITAAAVWWAWGALQPLPVVQDEYSYILQSRIFAHGHWTAPPPPVASSFQQPHVLTTPRVASKYPPGHALLLAPGALVGAPWLVPLILAGFSAALIFLLAESVAGPWIALVCWMLWLSDPIVLKFLPGYFSETTTALGWLTAFWLLRRWRSTNQARWLAWTGVAIGWMAITRPLTALAFAVPVGAFVLVRAGRQRLWRHVLAAGIVGTVVVSILPVWNVRTTGKWGLSPVSLYTRDYLPFDKPGFGFDSTPPAVPLSPVTAEIYAEYQRYHIGYSLAQVPHAAAERLGFVASDEWAGWRIALVPLVLIGLATASAELWFAIACAVVLFVSYLSYAYYAGWTLYYFEAMPVLAFLAANGVAVCWRWIARRISSRPLTSTLAWGTPAALAALTIAALVTWRGKHIYYARYDTAFYSTIATAPFKAMVVFVRYDPKLTPHNNLVANSATLATDRIWIAMDDPANNAAVLRAANGRVPVLFEENGGRVSVYESLLRSVSASDSLLR